MKTSCLIAAILLALLACGEPNPVPASAPAVSSIVHEETEYDPTVAPTAAPPPVTSVQTAPEPDPPTTPAAAASAPPTTMSLPLNVPQPPGDLRSIEERIVGADLIAIARMTNVEKAVETVDYYGERSGYVGVLKFTFRISEVLKSPVGSSPTEVIGMVSSTYPFETRTEAQTVADKMFSGRDTQWDDRDALIFLASSSVHYPATAAENVYFMSFIDYFTGIGDSYSIASLDLRIWLPEAQTNAGAGTASTQRRFLTAVPEQATASGGQAGASASTAETPSVALSELRTDITRLVTEQRANSHIGYQLCIYEKYRGKRISAEFAAEGRGSHDPEHTFNQEIYSGAPAGTEVLKDTWKSVMEAGVWESQSELQGPNAGLFGLGALVNPEPTSHWWGTPVFAVKQKIEFTYYDEPIQTVRPLPASVYDLTWKHTRSKYVLCAPEIFLNHTVTVTVTAPSGVLHEAFFDPVADGSAVAADASNGVLKPASFTDANNASATLQRIEWASGTVKMKLSPHTGLTGQTVDFIELDGSVSLSLDVADATADAANNTVSWSVSSQPWHPGDKLMLRIHKAVPAPQNVSVSLSEGTFTVSWSAITDAAEYRVQHRTGGSEAEWTNLDATTGTSQTFSPEGGVACGTTYEFRVQARGDGTTYSAAWGKLSEPTLHTTGACNQAPVFGSATYSFTVAENAPVWQSVGKVSATDPDEGDSVLYYITAGNGAGRFDISSGSDGGLILVWGTLDYETTSSYTLTVEARDGKAGGTSSTTVDISVTDVAE